MTVVDSDHHAFVSFSSVDRAKAKLICEQLEQAGIRCWISLRDVEPGTNFQASIVSAIQKSKIMVLVFSGNTNRSGEIHKELALASAFKIAVLPVRIVDVNPAGALLYELATRQWIDAFDDWDLAMKRLAATIRASLDAAGGAPVAEASMSSVALPAMNPAADRKAEPPATSFPQEQLDEARLALAHFLGPIADVLVRRASAKATSLTDLHDRLTTHIRSVDEQSAFRRRLSVGVGARKVDARS